MPEDPTCSCGCAAMQTISDAAPCRCGCSCCEGTRSREQEIAELRRLLDSTQRRLAELGAR